MIQFHTLLKVCFDWSYFNWEYIEHLNNLFGVFTGVILSVWFYYSQKQTHSKRYYDEIDGKYGGFTTPTSPKKEEKGLQSGIILTIRDTDDKGFFKGEMDYQEIETEVVGNHIEHTILKESILTILGKLDFRLHLDKTRHPFKPNQNRTYTGNFYIVDRFDFNFKDYKIEQYIHAEYKIEHYREMGVMMMSLVKDYRPEQKLNLPVTFTIQKSIGVNFEPYKNVKDVVFGGNTISDKSHDT
jgi:hypothetical protein